MLLAAAVLTVAVALLFLTAPRHENFWWTDAATFALNGELIRDYAASGFPRAPMAFANAWFLRYPALTISLYPPIFPMADILLLKVFSLWQLTSSSSIVPTCRPEAHSALRHHPR